MQLCKLNGHWLHAIMNDLAHRNGILLINSKQGQEKNSLSALKQEWMDAIILAVSCYKLSRAGTEGKAGKVEMKSGLDWRFLHSNGD